jgi:hypothetical protein
VATLEKKSGLADLGLKAADLVAAIRSPYGAEAERVKEALADKARDEKALTPEMRKVLARLEDAADPKTIEELKLDRTKRDPTRVEDAETRAEREETIRSLEAGEKLEDVQKLQDAVGRAHEDATKGEARDKASEDPAKAAVDTIQLLAAGAAATALAEKTPAKSDKAATEAKDITAETVRDLDAASVREQEEREQAKKEIFTLRVDDNGIYDLITRQLVAL